MTRNAFLKSVNRLFYVNTVDAEAAANQANCGNFPLFLTHDDTLERLDFMEILHQKLQDQ
jgi:hypothetical protein